MAQVPVYERQQSLRPAYQSDINVRSSPETFGAAVGRGMQDLGRGVGQLADVAAQVQSLQDETVARDARNAYLLDKDALMYGEGGYAATEGKAALDGFDKFGKDLGVLRKTHSAKLTPAQQKLFGKSVDSIDIDARRAGLVHKAGELKKYVVSTAANSADAFKQQALNAYRDQKTWDKYVAAGLAQLDDLGQVQGLPQAEVSQKKADFVSDVHKLTALQLAADDPIEAVEYVTKNRDKFTTPDYLNTLKAVAAPAGEAAGRDAVETRKRNGGASGSAVGTVVNKIIGVESGGNANAKNPLSSASGLGQFINSTWIKTVRKYRPDLADGKSNAELLAMKSSPALGREMTARYTQENAGILSAAGFSVTAGNLYLAHFLGPGGAKTILTAGDGASVRSILPHSVMKANPFLSGMSVADLKNWAAKKMGGAGNEAGVTFSPRVSAVIAGLPADVGAQVREVADRGVAQWDTQNATEIKAQRVAVNDNYRLRIATGDATVTAQEIVDDPVLDDGDKATLLNSYNEKNKALTETRESVAAFQAGALAVDPYSSDGRKTVDQVWGSVSSAVPQGTNLQPVVADIVQQTGIVPAPVMGALRMGLTSGNASTVASTAAYALNLSSVDPRALERREGGSEIRDAAVMYGHLTSVVGLSPDEAARRMIDARNPEKAKERKALLESEPVRTFIKDQAVEAKVRDIFDPGLFGFDPKLGETPMQSAAMVTEYQDMLTESLLDTAGDQNLAATLAADRFKRRYDVSEFSISGDKVVTRFPPEVTYPAGIDGTHGYVRDQLKAALAKEGITASEVFLQPDAATDADVKAGKPARYEVYYRQDGMLERFHLRFFAEPPSQADILNAKKKDAMRAREKNLDKWENGSVAGELPPMVGLGVVVPLEDAQFSAGQRAEARRRWGDLSDEQADGMLRLNGFAPEGGE
ncbi:MAG: hypothetical protein LCH46_07285 [Proteobacteria bacterium]|nr:hypothetical protein [Pseudomonadota bacterium]